MQAAGIAGLRYRQVLRPAAAGQDIAHGGVEVGVGGDGLSRAEKDGAQDVLGCSTLMGRHEEPESENLADRLVEMEEGTCAGVALVALHHRRPLTVAHGARPGVGQQIDVDVFGAQPEDVVAGLTQPRFAAFGVDQADGFDCLDAEGFTWIGGHAAPVVGQGKSSTAREASGTGVAVYCVR